MLMESGGQQLPKVTDFVVVFYQDCKKIVLMTSGGLQLPKVTDFLVVLHLH